MDGRSDVQTDARIDKGLITGLILTLNGHSKVLRQIKLIEAWL